MVLLMIDCENCSMSNIEKTLRNVLNTQVVFVVGNLQYEYKFYNLD